MLLSFVIAGLSSSITFYLVLGLKRKREKTAVDRQTI